VKRSKARRRQSGTTEIESKPHYTFEAFRRNTRGIRKANGSIVDKHLTKLTAAVRDFDTYFRAIEAAPDRLNANVRKLLSTKFFNHWYAALLLCEAGLMVDAISCERSAIETLAYHWLVCLDPEAAKDYQAGSLLKPVEVRRKLEVRGVDISHIRRNYAIGSQIGHVGRESERFHLRWSTETSGDLLMGGEFHAENSEHWMTYLPALLYLFCEPLMSSAAQDSSGGQPAVGNGRV